MTNDRRVKYTKKVLKESLIGFLSQKPISRISVKEICESADINRTTYYSHYTDQFDQLKQIESEFILGIGSSLSGFKHDLPEGDIVKTVEKILDYITENKQLCVVLLGENGDMFFQEKLITIIGGYVLKEWLEKPGLDTESAKFIFRFIATGCIGVIFKWISSGNEKSSHYMAELIVKLANNGLDVFYSKNK